MALRAVPGLSQQPGNGFPATGISDSEGALLPRLRATAGVPLGLDPPRWSALSRYSGLPAAGARGRQGTEVGSDVGRDAVGGRGAGG